MTLAEAHIEAERRIRLAATRAVEQIWRNLPGYDRENVDQWLSTVLPVVAASQRQSVSITEAYLARALERRPFGFDPNTLIGDAVRNGTPPDVVYKRPFVTMWSALGDSKPWQDAFNAGLARAQAAAAMDVQLSMRDTASTVGQADPQIQRFQRVADDGACEFCQEVDGAILNTDDAMALHNWCGCGIEVLEEARPITPVPSTVAVHQHGELGPVLASPSDDFTSLADIH